MRKALITGITGQDGSYLAEILLSKEYEVHGTTRRLAPEHSTQHLWRIRHILDKITLHSVSVDNYDGLLSLVESIKPDECYHLAAKSFVSYLLDDEIATINANINGVLHVLAVLRRKSPHCRLFFAASSEMFGKAKETPQNEDTVFHPRSPYGVSKVAGFELTKHYREAYDMYAASGILFNHESPRRGFEFVTRKITSQAAKIKLGIEKNISLGNIDAQRDWGHARDYVTAMWLILQQGEPDDYVIASQSCHSVREFLEVAFKCVGLNAYDYLILDEKLHRSAEDMLLKGDTTKANKKLGWKYNRSFEDLIAEMVEHDLAHFKLFTSRP